MKAAHLAVALPGLATLAAVVAFSPPSRLLSAPFRHGARPRLHWAQVAQCSHAQSQPSGSTRRTLARGGCVVVTSLEPCKPDSISHVNRFFQAFMKKLSAGSRVCACMLVFRSLMRCQASSVATGSFRRKGQHQDSSDQPAT